MSYRLYTLDDKFTKITYEWPTYFTGIVEWPDGDRQWMINGERHRLDGPAYISRDDGKYWFVKGKRHRLDGPAYESPGGHCLEWWVHGQKCTEKQHNLLVDIMKLKGLI